MGYGNGLDGNFICIKKKIHFFKLILYFMILYRPSGEDTYSSTNLIRATAPNLVSIFFVMMIYGSSDNNNNSNGLIHYTNYYYTKKK